MSAIVQLSRAAALCLSLACAPSTTMADEEPARSIYIVIENGGVVPQGERADAQETILHVLGELTELRHRRATNALQINIVLSASPTEVAWSGSPIQLFQQGHAVVDSIAFRDTCSDLVLAWEQVALTARITRPDEIALVAIGPAIHAGFPCSDETLITLPQAVPDALALGTLAQSSSFLRLVNVHPDQDVAYLDYLEGQGIMARVEAQEIDFDLMDQARTRAALGSILGGMFQ